MATEAHRFQVGVFVIAASIIGIATVIWLGASRFFEETTRFVTYFSESVQGLDAGAAVKYRGVPAGRVAAIRIAPDGELIEVLMDIDVEVSKVFKSDPKLRSTLELSGITGLRYIEIDRRYGDALNQSPVLSFKPAGELMPSSRSSFKALQAAFGDIYDKIMQVDLNGISSDTRAMLQAANELMRDQRVSAMLTNFAATSESTNKLAKSLEGLSGRLGPTIDNATQATAEAKTLIAGLNQSMSGEKISETLGEINRLAQSTQQFVIGLQSTMDRLDRVAGNLQSLTEEVRGQPSLLLFSGPPPATRPGNGAAR